MAAFRATLLVIALFVFHSFKMREAGASSLSPVTRNSPEVFRATAKPTRRWSIDEEVSGVMSSDKNPAPEALRRALWR